MRPEKVSLHYVQHGLQLAEYESSVLSHHTLRLLTAGNAQVHQQLLQGSQLGSVLYLDEVLDVPPELLGDDGLVAGVVLGENQPGMVADLLQVLQGLEDVSWGGAASLLSSLGLGPGKVLVELSLDWREITVVVLGDLGGQVGQNILLHSPG